MKAIVKLQTVQTVHQVVQDFAILNVLEHAVAVLIVLAARVVAAHVKAAAQAVPVHV